MRTRGEYKIISLLVRRQKLNKGQYNRLLEPCINRYNNIVRNGGQRFYNGYGNSSEKSELYSIISYILRDYNMSKEKLLEFMEANNNTDITKGYGTKKNIIDKLLNNIQSITDTSDIVKIMNYIISDSVIGYSDGKLGQILKNDIVWEKYRGEYLNNIFSKVLKVNIRGRFYRYGDAKAQFDRAIESFKVKDMLDTLKTDKAGTENMFVTDNQYIDKIRELEESKLNNTSYRERENIDVNIGKIYIKMLTTLVGNKIMRLINNREELIKYLNSI